MKEPEQVQPTSVLRGETVSSAQASIAGVAEPPRVAAAAAGATIVESRSGRRSIFPRDPVRSGSKIRMRKRW